MSHKQTTPEYDLTPEQQAEQERREQAFLEHRAANAPVKHKSAKKTATALKNLEKARDTKKLRAQAKKQAELAEAKSRPRKAVSDDEEEEQMPEEELPEEEEEEYELRPVEKKTRGGKPPPCKPPSSAVQEEDEGHEPQPKPRTRVARAKPPTRMEKKELAVDEMTEQLNKLQVRKPRAPAKKKEPAVVEKKVAAPAKPSYSIIRA